MNAEVHDPRGEFVANVVHFGRLLRSAGISVGTGRILDAIRAVDAVGVESREDFYWTMHAVFVNHPRQRLIFDQAFQVFWRNPRILERAMSLVLPQIRAPMDDSSQEMANRLSDVLFSDMKTKNIAQEQETETEIRATLTYSDRERLQTVDFDSMSKAELEQVQKVIAKMRFAFKELKTRRFHSHAQGDRLDMRKTIKKSLRGTADAISLSRMKRSSLPPPVVVLCDISGSMSEYSRMLLHFSHALMLSRAHVTCFVFGTRLTNVSRLLKTKDVDIALSQVSETVEDWFGGTRIGECLEKFNRFWVRRLPVHSSVVLLVTDGLDRAESGRLEPQIQLLHRSCRHLIWLNPLLRYHEFEPKVEGIRTMLPHVDEFRPVHNLDSLASLAEALTDRPWQQQKNDFYAPGKKWNLKNLSSSLTNSLIAQ